MGGGGRGLKDKVELISFPHEKSEFQAPLPPLDPELDGALEAKEFQESINSLLHEYDDRFVSRGYEELLDEKIYEIQREAERLEQRLWGGKENDFKF